ncbi:MAG: hypothetical protein AMXMBFR81_02700 [Chthonomonas sp.]|nr:hypothetical protein [Fimbriimonadaceae bacterium]
MTTLRDALIQGFEYDLWANLKWMAHLEQRGWPEPERGIFCHILAAQNTWELRLRGESPTSLVAPEPSEASLLDLHTRWVGSLEGDVERVIAYKRTTGEARSMSVHAIARHVINHGTYHRGELRGLCRAGGEEGFPETDMAGFFAS